MAYDIQLADRVREYLAQFPYLEIEEKKMFSGMAFLINDKMSVNISGENLMCRFDPSREEEVAEKSGYLPTIMKGKAMKGYCYVEPLGFQKPDEFKFWIDLCLEFNDKAKSSKKKKK